MIKNLNWKNINSEWIEDNKSLLLQFLKSEWAPSHISDRVCSILDKTSDEEVILIFSSTHHDSSIYFQLPGDSVFRYAFLSNKLTINGVRDQDNLGDFIQFLRSKKIEELIG